MAKAYNVIKNGIVVQTIMANQENLEKIQNDLDAILELRSPKEPLSDDEKDHPEYQQILNEYNEFYGIQ